MLVFVSMFMVVRMIMIVFLVLGTDAKRSFPGQSASAIFTHYSISIEASSISRPARNSPLGAWH
jgi:hypothetical protein